MPWLILLHVSFMAEVVKKPRDIFNFTATGSHVCLTVLQSLCWCRWLDTSRNVFTVFLVVLQPQVTSNSSSSWVNHLNNSLLYLNCCFQLQILQNPCLMNCCTWAVFWIVRTRMLYTDKKVCINSWPSGFTILSRTLAFANIIAV